VSNGLKPVELKPGNNRFLIAVLVHAKPTPFLPPTIDQNLLSPFVHFFYRRIVCAGMLSALLLDEELISLILVYLEPSVLCIMSEVNTRLKYSTTKDCLWREMCRRRWSDKESFESINDFHENLLFRLPSFSWMIADNKFSMKNAINQ